MGGNKLCQSSLELSPMTVKLSRDYCDYLALFKGAKTNDLGLKHTKPITSYKSVAPGTKL